MDVRARGEPKSVEIRAVVIKADGTRVDHGRVAYWKHRSRWRRLVDWLRGVKQ